MALADLVAAFAFMPETHTRRDRSKDVAPGPGAAAVKPSLLEVLSQRRLIVIFAIYFLTFLAMTNLQTVLALLVAARFSWGQQQVGLLFGLVGFVGLIVQGVLIGRLARAFGQLPLVLTGSVCLAAGMLRADRDRPRARESAPGEPRLAVRR
jgi:nitrate/nitrite transporter NarK